jgi:4-hydroxyphenylacetate 3-monooxygenase
MAIVEEPTRTEEHRLKNAEQYRQTLRDGRDVYYLGERVDDVTTHFAMAGGIDSIAEIYDLQFDDNARNVLTYVRGDGVRVTSSYLIPRTKEDLVFRREGIKFVARRSWGTHGRGVDMIATLPIGMYACLPSFRKHSPEYAENIASYIEHLEDTNIHLAETIVDPQGFRARATGTAADAEPPDRATARIVKESSEGIWISGIKGVGTAAPQANELILGSFHPPLDEESFWVYVPANAEGLRMFCREVVHRPGSTAYQHPLTSKGEEIEALVAFDNLFVPRERIMALRKRELHTVNFYNVWARWEHWYTFVRIVAKAEMYAGLAQLIVDTLELEDIPVIRQRVADVFEYALVLQGMQHAAEELAFPSENDVMTPHHNIVTAARSYAQENLPRVLHILQDICGQGLILRFDEKDLETPAAFGKNLSWFLDTRQVSAREKNLIMNLVWDVAASEHATRSKLFEESNALNVPFLKERMYGEWDRSQLLQEVRSFIGLEPSPERAFAPRMEAPSIRLAEEARRTLELELEALGSTGEA